jgi:twinkle protein
VVTESSFSHHEPCSACGSRNNLARYTDGHGYCFGCGHYEPGETERSERRVGETKMGRELVTGEFGALPARGITEETCRKFGYRRAVLDGQLVQVADYYSTKGELVAQKLRTKDKSFPWRGAPRAAALFGQQLWAPGGKRVIVTEGEIDALTVSQIQGNRWPVVSIKNGAQGAHSELLAQVEWLESFDTVVLCFDSDEPGRKAAVECAEIFSPGKCRIARLPMKDPNEMLLAGRVQELTDACWQAAPYRPDGIVSGVELIERVLEPPPPSIAYPWPSFNAVLRGQRTGEITMWCAGTGIGKSQVVREIAYSLRRLGETVGVIALEESLQRAALAQVSLEMGKRLHEPSVRASVTDDEIRAAAKVALDGIHFYEHFGSIGGDVLIPKIRFMAKALGVKWLVLDHISIMVSGTATEGDERKRIDELMTNLRTLTEECRIGMHVVSHLRKAGGGGPTHEEGARITLDDLRGSGTLKQIPDNIVALERNQQADDPTKRNLTTARALKCRMFGEVGVMGKLLYSSETGRITEVPQAEVSDTAATQNSDDGEDQF